MKHTQIQHTSPGLKGEQNREVNMLQPSMLFT